LSIDLFDKVVAPILLYGSEVWGSENLDIVERIHIKILKHECIQFKKAPRQHTRSMVKQGVPSMYFNIL
jgi:hypothetical protein